MIETINVESLLDEMASALQAILTQRYIVKPKIVGIRTGGVWIAQALCQRLGCDYEFGQLDISFYRDDFTQIGLNPRVTPSSLPFSTEGEHLILVDDVLMTGRTIRAAMNELFDYGRPASIILVALLDLGRKELPIHADIVGKLVHLAENERVKLQGPEHLSLKIEEKKSSDGET